MGRGVVKNAVRLCELIHSFNRLIRIPFENLERSRRAISDKDLIQITAIKHSVRLLDTRNAMNQLARVQVIDFDCLVVKGSNKQTMTFDVDTKSVEAPRDTWHWDRPHKLERRGRFRFSIDREKHNKCEQYRQALFHLQVSRLNSPDVKPSSGIPAMPRSEPTSGLKFLKKR